MARVLLLLMAIGLTVYALLDIGRTPRTRTRTMPKLLWFVTALVPLLGPGLWLLLGRPRPERAAAPAPSPFRPRRRAPAAPDDDPEFLRRLGDEAWARRMEEKRRGSGAPEPRAAEPRATEPPATTDPAPSAPEPRAERDASDDGGIS
jgi:hypothetical protein